ncbi:histidine phosphatase family protein [Acetobacter sacchari]|uniref:Histidine phosphatase family protein n=1 Tax=Acetobacter sacchari TaxID=2661687 RepID=A0ABS3LVQ9_9PROT|nr:histidine phosphatase family protein [Acetobacter sacchari]MBO1359994.1 histidine phosphatase family protein [Acetobacter sacchari]
MKIFMLTSSIADDVKMGCIPARGVPPTLASGTRAWLRRVPGDSVIFAGRDMNLIDSFPPTRQIFSESALSDRDHGQWHGRNLRDLPSDDLSRWIADPDFAPPEGETARGAFMRAAAWLDEAPHTGVDVVVVAQPSVVRTLLIHALGGGVEMAARLDIPPSSLSVMTRHTHWRVASMGTLLD